MSEPDIHTRTTTVPRPRKPDQPLAAYLARPDSEGVFPGVIVIHEAFGLNDNIRDITRRFAREGYVALAVDLFTGNKAACMLRIISGILFNSLHNGIVLELRSALTSLSHMAEVDPQRVGVIGFCMGGSYALQLACVDERLAAASVFYGQNPCPLEAIAQACPILGSYPANDATARQARKLESALERTTVAHHITIYPDSKHSFFNDQSRNYNPQAAAAAWRRTLSFFEQHFGGAETY